MCVCVGEVGWGHKFSEFACSTIMVLLMVFLCSGFRSQLSPLLSFIIIFLII